MVEWIGSLDEADLTKSSGSEKLEGFKLLGCTCMHSVCGGLWLLATEFCTCSQAECCATSLHFKWPLDINYYIYFIITMVNAMDLSVLTFYGYNLFFFPLQSFHSSFLHLGSETCRIIIIFLYVLNKLTLLRYTDHSSLFYVNYFISFIWFDASLSHKPNLIKYYNLQTS